jgi:peptide-methionine (S)-S-oxide reductase
VSDVATVAGGCFWCLEAVFERLGGVSRVVSGYTGGRVENPSYHDVCTGTTGHAEALQVTFDPAMISYEDLLEIFFAFHDPTTLNRQGPDQGTQYRSAILYHDAAQKNAALRVMERLTNTGVFDRPIVTELAPLRRFFPAEASHQEYYRRNPAQAYCQAWIAPKVAKLRAKYSERLKT